VRGATIANDSLEFSLKIEVTEFKAINDAKDTQRLNYSFINTGPPQFIINGNILTPISKHALEPSSYRLPSYIDPDGDKAKIEVVSLAI